MVTDEGHRYHGPGEIHAWLARSAGEYTYTSTLAAARRLDDDHFDAVHHLEGDFPGAVVDLHFRFALRDGRITRLVIEP
ncbi:nuclear transport factor 2 family protein [Actinospica sp.]|uniref:nuclear transport factor 2 family protein n=1 Tax=Actinospica sp. TaxID=1872142 RepID=UPI0032C2290A